MSHQLATARQQTPNQSPESASPDVGAAPGPQADLHQLALTRGNDFILGLIAQAESGGVDGVPPDDALKLATSGPASPLPFRDEVAATLGTSFDDVEAYLGTPEAVMGLAAIGAEAAQQGRKVAFMEANPSKETVLHEATHLAQAEGQPESAGAQVSTPGQAVEREAEQVAQSASPDQPAQLGQQASGNTIHRSLFGGILGGVLGAIAGGVAGFFIGGPLGAIAGAIIGGVGGAVVGDAVSRDSRGLRSDEIAYAKDIFGDSIDYAPIKIVRNSMISTGASKTLGNSMYLEDDWGGAVFNDSAAEPLTLTSLGRQLLIHEMGHVWQYQNGGLAYVGDSLWAQLKASLGSGSRNGAYEWRPNHDAGVDWADWNPEQQAQAIEDYNLCLRAAKSTPPTATDEQRETLTILEPYMEKVRSGEGAPQFSTAGAVGGGLAGAGVGALIGGAAGGPIGALVGAGIGGIAGALFGGG